MSLSQISDSMLNQEATLTQCLAPMGCEIAERLALKGSCIIISYSPGELQGREKQRLLSVKGSLAAMLPQDMRMDVTVLSTSE